MHINYTIFESLWILPIVFNFVYYSLFFIFFKFYFILIQFVQLKMYLFDLIQIEEIRLDLKPFSFTEFLLFLSYLILLHFHFIMNLTSTIPFSSSFDILNKNANS